MILAAFLAGTHVEIRIVATEKTTIARMTHGEQTIGMLPRIPSAPWIISASRIRLPRMVSEYRQRVVLKASDRQALIDKIWEWYAGQNFNKNQLKIQIDIDPYVLD